MNDTIAAISTSLGIGAISIVRVSGDEAINIVNKIFKGKNLTKVKSHTINYGHIHNNDEIIDEVLVTVMKKPKTFTCEDVVEINGHGGIITTNKILELLLISGARLAEPGEFTKRAFLNGRIDLVEAEAIIDLIDAKNESSQKMAINQLKGRVSELVRGLRKEVLNVMANIEVNIDYPEYEDATEITYKELAGRVEEVKTKISKVLDESYNGQLIRNGIETVIIGRPNVGKSSILNKLLDEEKAIVTDIPGTTRDVIEGTVNMEGITLNIMDTAGIRKTENIIEQIGVEKSHQLIDKADLIIVVLNNNEPLTDDDLEIIDRVKDNKHIIVINKVDLDGVLDRKKITSDNIVTCNTIEKDGLDNLKHKIKEMFNLEQLETKDPTYLSNVRQITKLKESLTIIDDIDKAIKEEVPIDIIEIDIKKIWLILGEIIGETYNDELLDEIFSKFCLGK